MSLYEYLKNFKIQIAGAVGDCTGDTFTASSPSLGGSPVICGYNTGQHSKIHNNYYNKLFSL